MFLITLLIFTLRIDGGSLRYRHRAVGQYLNFVLCETYTKFRRQKIENEAITYLHIFHLPKAPCKASLLATFTCCSDFFIGGLASWQCLLAAYLFEKKKTTPKGSTVSLVLDNLVCFLDLYGIHPSILMYTFVSRQSAECWIYALCFSVSVALACVKYTQYYDCLIEVL